MIEFLTLVLLAGAVLYHSLGIGLLIIGIISALTSAFFFTYFLSQKGLVFALLIGSMIFLGAATASDGAETVPKAFFAQHTIIGTVESVDRHLDKTNIIVKDRSFGILVECTLHDVTDILPGDTIQITGTMQQPEDFMTNTGRMFPYQQYLQSKGVVAVVPVANGTVISRGVFVLGTHIWRIN